METSLILAKFWGFFASVYALVFLLNPKALNRLFEYIKDEKFLFIIGFISFTTGLINVLLHNVWVADWRVIITLFGWIALVKGISRTGFTAGTAVYLQKMNFAGIRWAVVPVLLIGIFLLYCGFYKG